MTLPSITPVQSDVLNSLRNFLQSTLPGIEIVRGQDNRVSGPLGPDYVVMTPITMKRLETNIDLYADCAFTAYTDGSSTLTITQMQHGAVIAGHQLYPTSSILTPATFIDNFLSGTPGGIGTYILSGPVISLPSQTMASGVMFAMQPTEVCVQIDVYGPNSFANSQIISTLFRDDYAIENFASSDIPPPPGWQNIPSGGTLSLPWNSIRPLFADDPVQLSTIFGEVQYEIRWKVDAYLQANMIVTVGQTFAGTVRVYPLVAVDAVFPA